MSSSWPIVIGLIALALGAVWYDARNAPPDASPNAHAVAAAAAP